MNIPTPTLSNRALLNAGALVAVALIATVAMVLFTTMAADAQSNARLTLETSFDADPDQQITYRVIELGTAGGYSATVKQTDGESVNLFPPGDVDLQIIVDTGPTGGFATRLDCDRTNATVADVSQRGTATVSIDPGAGTTCTWYHLPAQVITIAVDEQADAGLAYNFNISNVDTDWNAFFVFRVSEGTPAQVRIPTGSVILIQPRNQELMDGECDAADFVPAQGELMPGVDVICEFTVAPAAALTIVSEVVAGPEAPTEPFTYVSFGLEYSYFTIDQGAITTNAVTVAAPIRLRQLAPVGWQVNIDCGPGIAVDWFPVNAKEIEISIPSGDSATCTFTNTWSGVAAVSFELDPDGIDVPVFVGAADGSSLDFLPTTGVVVFSETADQEFGYQIDIGSALPSAIVTTECVDNNGTITQSEFSVVASLPPNGSLNCVIQITQGPSIPISLTVAGPAQTFAGFIRFASDNSLLSTISLTAGETWTGDAYLGTVTEVGAFFADPADESQWALTDFSCVGDQGLMNLNVYNNSVSQSGYLPPDAGLTAIDCTLVVRDLNTPYGIFPTVTCLGGNGRIDINVQNDGVERVYQLEIGALAPRIRTVAAFDWWRSPVTGRPDGPIQARLLRDGEVLLDQELMVDCDDEDPSVTAPEVQLMQACRNGKGFAVWQFANTTDAPRSYIIEFQGVPNRSSTAAPHGAAVRGVSGRADGTHQWVVAADGVVVRSGSVTFDCSSS